MDRQYTSEKWAYTLLASAAFCYVCMRAWLSPLVNDEAISFFHFIYPEEFFPFTDAYWTANNHFINSLLAWVFLQWFGVAEFSIRLPNLLAFILYLYFTYKIGARLTHPLLRLAFWLCLITPQPLLEFFGYCRGYGLSIAFMMGAIWHFYRAYQRGRLVQNWSSFLFIWLAVGCNLNLVSTYLIWFMWYALLSFKRRLLVQWSLKALLFLAALIPFIRIGFTLRQHQELYYGSFFSITDSFQELSTLVFGREASPGQLVVYAFCALSILFFLHLLIRKNRRKNPAVLPLLFLSFFLLNVVAALLQFYLFHIPFPVNRTLLHWLPLFFGGTLFGFTLFEYKAPLFYFISLPLLAVPFFQLPAYNLHHAEKGWRMQQFPEAFYTQLEKARSQTGDGLLFLETEPLFNTAVFDFLNLKRKGQLNPLQEREKPGTSLAHFVVSTKKESSALPTYKAVLTDEYSGTTLWQRREKTPLKKIHSKEYRPNAPEESNWFSLVNLPLDSGCSAPLVFVFSLNLRVDPVPRNLGIYIQVKDEAENIIHAQKLNLQGLRNTWEVFGSLRASSVLYDCTSEARQVEAFIWNDQTSSLYLSSAECTIFTPLENS